MQRAPLGNGGPFIGHRVKVTIGPSYTHTGVLLAYCAQSVWDNDMDGQVVVPALVLLLDDDSVLALPVGTRPSEIFLRVETDELLP